MVAFFVLYLIISMGLIEKIEQYEFAPLGWECVYIVMVILINLFVRLVFSILRATAANSDPALSKVRYREFYGSDWKYRTRIIFKGCDSVIDPSPDLWYNSVIGIMELLTFPILMRVDGQAIIGAWIGFKTVAQWSKWTKDNRLTFNRYLIGCAINVLISYLLMRVFIPCNFKWLVPTGI